jgi:hypothetical protein
MPGGAFNKPGVNKLHKSEVRKIAVQLAEQTAATTGSLKPVLAEISSYIDASALEPARKRDFHAAVREALRKVERDTDPLSGLTPPPGCGPCHCAHGGTHHPFCQSRKREPGAIEKTVRDATMRRLATLWRGVIEAAVRCHSLEPVRSAAARLLVRWVGAEHDPRHYSHSIASRDAQKSHQAVAQEDEGAAEDGTVLESATAVQQGPPDAPQAAPAPASSGTDVAGAAPSSSTAVDISICTEIDRVLDEAMEAAAGLKAREEMAFNVPEKARTGWAKLAQREAAWMRVELAGLLDGASLNALPAGCADDGSVLFQRQRVVRRSGSAEEGGGTRERPNIYSYIVDGARGHVINFGTKEATLKLEEHGLGSCPCASSDCCGSNGRWHTHPTRWGHKTSAPQVHLYADGLAGPIESVWAKCDDVRLPCSNVHAPQHGRRCASPHPRPPRPPAALLLRSPCSAFAPARRSRAARSAHSLAPARSVGGRSAERHSRTVIRSSCAVCAMCLICSTLCRLTRSSRGATSRSTARSRPR